MVSEVTVQLDNSTTRITIGKANFELNHPTDVDSSGKPKSLASYYAIPIKLAWALTTSKSQGMSIRSVKVKPENFFLDAEAYVAFSRCGETLVLDDFNFEKRVKVNKKALNFYKNLEKFNSSIATVSANELDDIFSD
jgi:ATP-dependent exoDNAse (exonuclease V) alpha subunit